MGPLLFQIYVGKVLERVHKQCYRAAYADDFVIAYHAKDNTKFWANDVGNKLNRSLKEVYKECCKIGVELDQRKTKAMWLSPHKKKKFPNLILKLGDRKLGYVTEYKYLGVIFDNRLTFRKWIQRKISEAKRRNKYILRLKGVVMRKLRVLWRGYVESYFMYSLPQVYDLLANDLKQQLHQFYHQSAKIITGLIPSTPAEVALLESGLQPLEELIANRKKPKKERKKYERRVYGMQPGPVVRHVEVTFSRWRCGYLYTNLWKQQHGFKDCDGLCRMCKTEQETREHVIFHCKSVDEKIRAKYLSKLTELYRIDSSELTMNHIFGAFEHIMKRQKREKLAWALTDYLDELDFHA